MYVLCSFHHARHILTQRREAHKALKSYRETLRAESAFHKQRDIGALKLEVEQVDGFLRSLRHTLPRFSSEGFERDLVLGWRGIVAEQKPAKSRPARPTLNTSDLDEYSF